MVEIFLDGDWVHYDPTHLVPNENILDSNNLIFENSKPSTTNSLEITGKDLINWAIFQLC